MYNLQRGLSLGVYMVENGFYKVTQEFIELIRKLGGTYKDAKERPIFCCIKDKFTDNLYWAIPTSDLSHRDDQQVRRIESLIALPDRDIRSSWYHIGHTNKPAIYRISSCFPITEKYIDGEYTSQGKHLMLANQADIAIIRRKLYRILLSEKRNPNKYEQHITVIEQFLVSELEFEKAQREAASTN